MTSRAPLPDDLLADIDRLAPHLTLLDHYAVLGVAESASEAEIKAAYLRLIQRFHPDRWAARDSGAHRKRMEAIFARATEAYEALRRPESRLEYDRSLYEVRGIPRPSAKPQPIAPARPASVAQVAQAARLVERLRPPTIPAPAAVRPPAPAPAPAPPTPASPVGHASGATRPLILVVEDDDTLRRMLVRILGELGTVREARDGAEGLELASAEPMPRLVVTDLMMPRMDGLELARQLKRDPRTSRIPIVMLTAKGGPKDVIDGVNAGARFYVTKPFKVDELKTKAKKALGPG